MSHKVLLDANLLIAAYDDQGTTSPEIKALAIARITELANDPETSFFITPLIRYEVLRGIGWQQNQRFEQLRQILDQIPELEITRQASELSANLFRFDSWEAAQPNAQPRNLEKRKFDIFHFAIAQCNGLQLSSQDSDIAKIRSLYERYLLNAA